MNGLLAAVGLVVGLALYAMLLAMVLGARRARTGLDGVALATAVLGLTWYVCALTLDLVPAFAPRWVAVCAFSALGFLPAVVVHSVLRGRSAASGVRTVLRVLAYGGSGAAAMLQFEGALNGHPVPSVLGFRLLTVVFVGLLGPLAWLTRGQPGARRALWAVALAAFAVSALHLSQYDETAAWPIELIGHNASIPLAVAILYQDYPFAFADLFVKRALTLIAVVGAVSLSFWIAGVGLDGVLPGARPGLLLVCCVVTALSVPFIAQGSSWFVDTIVLTRPDYRDVQHRLYPRLQNRDDVPGILDEVCRELATALSASSVRWRELPDPMVGELPDLVSVEAGRRAEVRVPATEAPRFAIEIDDLTHGRRILSGDETMLSAVAMIAARRVDGVRLGRERYDRELREREIAQLMSEAELRALRAQLNPHFLFNALTTIGHLIQEAPPRALDTLLQLTTLLRAMLRPEGEFTTLGRELEIVDAYLAIELARFEDRLRVGVDVPDECREVRLPSLLVQPLVENAIKHGIAPARAGGEVMITARLVDSGGRRLLTITVRDSSPTRRRSTRRPWSRGVGLSSVERRLACHYGEAAALTIHADAGATIVDVSIPAPATTVRDERRAG